MAQSPDGCSDTSAVGSSEAQRIGVDESGFSMDVAADRMDRYWLAASRSASQMAGETRRMGALLGRRLQRECPAATTAPPTEVTRLTPLHRLCECA